MAERPYSHPADILPVSQFSRRGGASSSSASAAGGGLIIGSVVEGVVQGHRDGHGFVVSADSEVDVYLAPAQMRSVLHQDRVRVRIASFDRRGRPEGQIVDIVERSRAPIIGKLIVEQGVAVVAPEDKRYGQDILLPPGAQGAAKPGEIVVAEITEPPSPYAQPVGRVVEVLGTLEDSGIEIEIAVRKFGVPHVFSELAEIQCSSIPDSVQPKDLAGRVDLTDVPLVTIDGEDARDFDDAVFCLPHAFAGEPEPGFRMLVAIADVSHYVTPDSALDRDAFERATSVYFPRRVIPMLPEKLSNGLCSLNPDVVRLALVCDALIDAGGHLRAYQFYPAAIRSHARLTYTQAWAMLSNSRGPEARAQPDLLEPLNHLYELYQALRRARESRGAVDFETTETYIVCDAGGRIERIVARERNDAHRLIEECMLAANVCAADFLVRRKQAALYRVHEGPTPERLATLRAFLKAHGQSIGGDDDPRPKDFQEVANRVRGLPEAPQVHTMLLRSMQQAIYSPHNSGHFGLAYEAYTHFTSPIRRYPDLLVHRAIKAQLAGQKFHLPEIKLPPSAPAPRLVRGSALKAGADAAAAKARKAPQTRSAKELLAWEAAGAHCSACERRADEASRDVEAWLKCWFMRDRLGEEFVGTVTGVTAFGLFVQLDAMFVEGMVHVTELGGDYYRFDEQRFELRGERTGVRYALGDKLQVQVGRVDLDARRIEFRLLKARGLAGGVSTKPQAVSKSRPPLPAAQAEAAGALGEPSLTSSAGETDLSAVPLAAMHEVGKGGAKRAKSAAKRARPGHAVAAKRKAAAKARDKRAAPAKKRRG